MKAFGYDLTLGTGGIRTVRAYDPGVPGLVVYRRISGPGWEVTHKTSGLALRSWDAWPTRTEAFAFAQAIAGLRDWRRPLPRNTNGPAYKALVAALRERGAL